MAYNPSLCNGELYTEKDKLGQMGRQSRQSVLKSVIG